LRGDWKLETANYRNGFEYVASIPTVFSFIDNPDETIATLRGLACAALARRTGALLMAAQDAQELDHCAESVAATVLRDATSKRRLDVNGVYPFDMEIREIVMATGAPQELGHVQGEFDDYLRFKLRRGRKSQVSGYRSSEKEAATTNLVEYLNECLGKYDFELAAEEADLVSELAGEVLANGEEHGGSGEWFVAGYMRQPRHLTYGDCHITIFNVGRTIYDTLRTLPKSSLLRKEIDERVARHTRRRLFSHHWTKENLWTVYALQEAVSRHNRGESVLGNRGVGTVKMIEFFQSIGRSSDRQPRMCLVSGSTHVLFDGRHKLETVDVEGGRTRRIIAFNQANDLDLPPDPTSVRNLGHPFPGTLLSLRFYLEREHLSKIH
jgi:hypothetical protein